MHVASLLETKTGVTHRVRNPSMKLWNVAARKQKKKELPDKARFNVWTQCGVHLRANSLTTSQSVTCIACLMQEEEKAPVPVPVPWEYKSFLSIIGKWQPWGSP